MTRGVNQLILVGYTTQAPEIRYTSDGRAIANITIATNEKWKDKVTGEKKNKAEYHRVVIFGKLAEITGEYVKKGDLLYVCGSLQPRKWQDQNGLDRYTAEVIVNIGETLQMLGGRDRENISTASTVNWEQPSHTQTVPVNRPANVQPMNVPPMDFSEDIPF